MRVLSTTLCLTICFHLPIQAFAENTVDKTSHTSKSSTSPKQSNKQAKPTVTEKSTNTITKPDHDALNTMLNHFYDGLDSYEPKGIPDVNHHPFYENHLSSQLLKLLIQSKEVEKTCQKTNALFADNAQAGNIFLGDFLNSGKMPTYRNITQKGNTLLVDVSFSSISGQRQWIDQIELIHDNKTWRINNIKFHIDQKSTTRFSLVDELSEFIITGNEACSTTTHKG